MKNFEFHNRVIHDVTEKLKELDIDLFLIITSEGSDKMTRFIPESIPWVPERSSLQRKENATEWRLP